MLDVSVRFTNRARDHRLRLVVPTNVVTARSLAQMQWDVVSRPTAVQPPDEAVWIEDAPTCHPTHGLVDAPAAGLAIVAQSLREYELSPRGELALTLLRAVGHLAAPDPLTMASGAGPQVETPDAQLLEQTLELHAALVPHASDADLWSLGLVPATPTEGGRVPHEPEADLWSLAGAWQNPPRAFPQSRHAGSRPPAGRWVEVTPGLDVSALKEAEDGDGVILRLFNPDTVERDATVRVDLPVRSATAVRLDESRLAELPLDRRGAAGVRMRGRGLCTLRWRAAALPDPRPAPV